MNSELRVALANLIDETIGEIEQLKKSRFSAAEVKLDGPGSDGIAGKPANGSMGKKEDEKKEKDEDEEEEAEKAEGTNEEAEKAEGTNEEAEKAEDEDDEEEAEKADDEKDEDKEDKKDEKKADMSWMKKSLGEQESLMKSYVDQKIAPLEDKLSTIVDLVTKLADQPVAPRGVSSRVAPLLKSVEEGVQPLTKSQVADKLFELKKSGSKVDSLDIAKAEMGQDLAQIQAKYKIS